MLVDVDEKRYGCSLNQHLLVRYIFVHTRNNSFVHTRNVQSVRIPYIFSIYISGGRNVWIFIQVCSSQGCTWVIPFVWRQIHPAVRTWDVVWMSCARRACILIREGNLPQFCSPKTFFLIRREPCEWNRLSISCD